MLCLQEVDHIDDFYDAKLQELGFSVCYGKRDGSPFPGVPEKNTIAIAYKSNEWVLIDFELIDFSDISRWSQCKGMEEFEKPKRGMLCMFQH